MISPNFTVEDIREVRRQIDHETEGMTLEQAFAYIHRGAIECEKHMKERWEVTKKRSERDGD